MTEELLAEMANDMKSAQAALKNQLATVRTGRASPQLLDSLKVNVTSYGAEMPLKQLATITAPDARLLVVTPWDKSTILDIEKAISIAALGLNPSNDGQLIRVPIPPLTGERRHELVRVVRKYGEEFKVRARGVRKEYRELFTELESDKDISEDELKRLLDKVQSATDNTVKAIEATIKAKEQEILEV
jgi:ribosome recycling factor